MHQTLHPINSCEVLSQKLGFSCLKLHSFCQTKSLCVLLHLYHRQNKLIKRNQDYYKERIGFLLDIPPRENYLPERYTVTVKFPYTPTELLNHTLKRDHFFLKDMDYLPTITGRQDWMDSSFTPPHPMMPSW